MNFLFRGFSEVGRHNRGLKALPDNFSPFAVHPSLPAGGNRSKNPTQTNARSDGCLIAERIW